MDVQYDPHDNSEVREEKATLRIKMKVAVLEQWKQEGGPPKDVYCPIVITAFNKWEGQLPEIEITLDAIPVTINEVFKVSSVNMNKKENTLLKGRAIKLMGELVTLSRPKEDGQSVKILKLTAERDEAIASLQRVTNEFIEMRYIIMELEKGTINNRHDINILNSRIAELIIQNKKKTYLNKKDNEHEV